MRPGPGAPVRLLVFEETVAALRAPARPTGRHHWRDEETREMTLPEQPSDEPVAATAGEQDHDDPWQYASEEYVDPPADSGRPAFESGV